LRRPAGDPEDLFMIITPAAVLSLTLAALPVRGQQQQGHRWGPISGRL
jgi:hypothetical protein